MYKLNIMQRDLWTKKLTRIISDIEAGKPPVPVRELYVFGSYARGALQPNDLDIVVIHDEPSAMLLESFQKKADSHARSYLDSLYGGISRFEAQLRKALRRPGERIDILSGSNLHQACSSRTVPQDELRLVWSHQDRDWQSKLDSIPLDSQAGTAPRDEFISPKLAQALAEDVKYVTGLLVQQQLTLLRVPADSLVGQQFQPSSESLPDDNQLRDWGKVAKEHYPFARAWLTSQGIQKFIATGRCELFDIQFRYRVHLGKMNLLKMIDIFKRSQVYKQCLIPFFKRGYSRDLLVFERGPRWQMDDIQ